MQKPLLCPLAMRKCGGVGVRGETRKREYFYLPSAAEMGLSTATCKHLLKITLALGLESIHQQFSACFCLCRGKVGELRGGGGELQSYIS